MSAYPPPPPGYQPPPAYGGPPNTHIFVNQPMVVSQVPVFREFPVRCTCPACNAEVTTSTTYEVGTVTWVVCLILAFIGLWMGCCLIPFCLNASKDVVHTCPSCRHTIGKYNRM